MEAAEPEDKWALRIGQHGILIEPSISSCREFDCCLGKDCGLTLVEAQGEVVAYYQGQADYWRDMKPEEFLKAQGYKPN